MSDTVPTLYDWLGGAPALEKLMTTFYQRVPNEPLLAPVFANMSPAHAKHVAAFIGEVFGGPKVYSTEYGGHANMIRHHIGRSVTEPQRKRWMALLLECADELGVPDDPEFRSAFVAYIEWGSRLAVLNSAPGTSVVEEAPMPEWNWGVPKGPYIAPST